MLSLEKLLYELLRHADLSDNRLVFPTRKFVENLLTREMDFDYSPGMACQVLLNHLSDRMHEINETSQKMTT